MGVWVCVDPYVRDDRIANSKQGLEAVGKASTEVHYPERDAREPLGVHLSKIWDATEGDAWIMPPRWGGRR